MNSYTRLMLTLLLAGALAGCAGYRQWIPQSKISSGTKGEMEILLLNGDVVRMHGGKVSDRSLVGRGTRIRADGASMDFGGRIGIDSVALVQLHRKDAFASLFAASAEIIVLGVGTSAVGGGSGVADVVITYPSGGGYFGSCPLAYSFDGDSLCLESETYVGAICTKLERTATDVLRRIRPSGDSLTVRIMNDSPETHLTNSVTLLAVDHPAGTVPVADIRGNLHTVSDPLPCVAATDRFGNDITAQMRPEDAVAYATDLSRIDPHNENDLRDAITCRFDRPAGARHAKLVVRCMNSDLGDFGLNRLFSLRGDAKLHWYHRLENDPLELRKLFAWMTREGGLEVSIKQQGHWVRAGIIAGVGGRAFGERLIMLDLGPEVGTSLEVKLEGTSGLWIIDAVSIDYSKDLPLDITEAPRRSTSSNVGIDATPLLASDDSQYLRTTTDQWVNLSFDTVATRGGMSRSYVLQTRGHYFGWYGQDDIDNSAIADRILTEPLYGSKLYFKDWLATQTALAGRAEVLGTGE
ncbi:MAG: hypothetical protein NDJ18_08710 [candidate division Zixibacteria bacterium]|nr:hypothetical protein [candidate division Zixibacteria bacterium]